MQGRSRLGWAGRTAQRVLLLAGPVLLVEAPALAQPRPELLPEIPVTSSRTGAGIVGASNTEITAEDIERSPAQTLPEILSREPGIQVTNLFGGVNGARSVVDMRGFGAAATSNTLVLINGRRITDLDIVGYDLAAIPRDSIARIEITRGNSGAVLYGDGAVGGVINIVTKSGASLPPQARISGAFGSFNYTEGNFSAQGSQGPWSGTFFSNLIHSDGYRQNNYYRQSNAVGDVRYTVAEGSFYANVTTDNSHLGLPGARRHDPVRALNQIANDPQGATTPFDFAEKRGTNGTMGLTRIVAPGVELIVDGGIRRKQEEAAFFVTNLPNNPTTNPLRAVNTTLTTVSATPRLKIDSAFAQMPWKAIGGIDYYRAQYDSSRMLYQGAPPFHIYALAQSTAGYYWQQTVTLLPSTDFSAGVRLQRTTLTARDQFQQLSPGGDFCSPPCFPTDVQALPLDSSEVNDAHHFGLEHRFNPNLSVFGRTARSFRVPNVDERIGMVAAGGPTPSTFGLRTQKSRDWEAGARTRIAGLDVQWSIYDMMLNDEIHFRFGPAFESNNINLDPTRRYGSETIASYQLNERIRLKGGYAYTRSVFREGLFAGKDVPLVSRRTGSLGFAWDIWPRELVFDAIVRYVGARRMDNDQLNIQPLIPAHAVVDVRLGGERENRFWSVAVLNVFDERYFDYSIASPFPFGFASQLNTYNAYPQPGRSFLVKAGSKF
jgi:iron complex outermembrane recepter protein